MRRKPKPKENDPEYLAIERRLKRLGEIVMAEKKRTRKSDYYLASLNELQGVYDLFRGEINLIEWERWRHYPELKK